MIGRPAALTLRRRAMAVRRTRATAVGVPVQRRSARNQAYVAGLRRAAGVGANACKRGRPHRQSHRLLLNTSTVTLKYTYHYGINNVL